MKSKSIFLLSILVPFSLFGEEDSGTLDVPPETNTTVVDPLHYLELQDTLPTVNFTTNHDYIVGTYDFTTIVNFQQSEKSLTPTAMTTYFAESWAMAPLQLDIGKRITTLHVYGIDNNSNGGMIVELRRKTLHDNKIEVVATITTFQPTGPLSFDLAGNILWSGYTGPFDTAFEHIYDATGMLPLVYDRRIEFPMDHVISSGASYYLHVYTVGEAHPSAAQFWSAAFDYLYE